MKRHSWPENHWHWPVELTHQHGVRCRDLVFTGGQADLDKNGNVVNPELLKPQCKNVIGFVRDILYDLDASLEHVVRWVVYFVGDATDEAYILSQLAKATSDNCMPTVSTVCLPALCYPGMRIELEAIAWCPATNSAATNAAATNAAATNAASLPHYAYDETLPMLAPGFSHAVRCNDLIFTSDCSATGPSGDVASPGDMLAQTELMMDTLERTLGLVGATLADVLKLNVFYQGDGTAENWAEPALIRASRFPDPGPAATGIAVPGFSLPGLMTKIAVTAGVEALEVDRDFAWPEGHWDWTEKLPYKHGNRFKRLIHLGGQVALDQNANVIHPDNMVEQTRVAMQNIESVLAELGGTLADVVKVTTFYQGNASAAALHENLLIRSGSYQFPGPATSGIPVTHLVYESMLIEIEVIAMLN